MIKVRGIYDGKQVRLLEALDVPPETEVEVVVLEPEASDDDAYWRALREAGLVLQRPRPWEIDDSFEPIPNPGEPISDTIIRERR